jgi:hypothetical protein
LEDKHVKLYNYKLSEKEKNMDKSDTSTGTPVPNFTYALKTNPEKLVSTSLPNTEPNLYHSTTVPSVEDKHVKLYNYKLIKQEETKEGSDTSTESPLPNFTYALKTNPEKLVSAPHSSTKQEPNLHRSTTVPSVEDKNVKLYNFKIIEQEERKEVSHPPTETPIPKFTYALRENTEYEKPISAPPPVKNVEPNIFHSTNNPLVEDKHVRLYNYKVIEQEESGERNNSLAEDSVPNFTNPFQENSDFEKLISAPPPLSKVEPNLFHSMPVQPMEDKHVKLYNYKRLKQEERKEASDTSSEHQIQNFGQTLEESPEFEKLISAPHHPSRVEQNLFHSTPVPPVEDKHVKLYNYKVIEQDTNQSHSTERPFQKFTYALKTEGEVKSESGATFGLPHVQSQMSAEMESDKSADDISSTESSLPRFTYGLKDRPLLTGDGLMQESASTMNYLDNMIVNKTADPEKITSKCL